MYAFPYVFETCEHMTTTIAFTLFASEKYLILYVRMRVCVSLFHFIVCRNDSIFVKICVYFCIWFLFIVFFFRLVSSSYIHWYIRVVRSKTCVRLVLAWNTSDGENRKTTKDKTEKGGISLTMGT